MNNTDIKSLKTALKRLKPFSESKPNLPIMGYIKLQSRDSTLRLTVPNSRDFGKGMSFTSATVPTGTDDFTVCVRYTDLMKVIGKCKADVRFTLTGSTLEMQSGSLKFKLNGHTPDDFPALPEFETDYTVTSALPYGDISSELAFVSTATCPKTPNCYTSGILFDYTEPGRLRLVGTDGRRLHSTYTASNGHTVQDETGSTDSPVFLVPVLWTDAFNRLKVPADETVILKFHDVDYLTWEVPSEGLSGTVSLQDNPYPDYRNVIPDDCRSRFRLNVPGTIEALNAVSVVATTQDGRDMVVVNANGTLNLTARSDTMGEASGTVDCNHLDGPETVFALNVHYFTETLKLAGRDAVVMTNSGSLEPVRFDYGHTDRVAVVMPVRLPE